MYANYYYVNVLSICSWHKTQKFKFHLYVNNGSWTILNAYWAFLQSLIHICTLHICIINAKCLNYNQTIKANYMTRFWGLWRQRSSTVFLHKIYFNVHSVPEINVLDINLSQILNQNYYITLCLQLSPVHLTFFNILIL